MTKSRPSSFKLLTLLSTSGISLAPAVAALGAAGVMLTPAAALAENECAPVGVDPSANGAVSDSYTCSGAATYTASGITYDSDGPITITSGSLLRLGTEGLNVVGNGADSITVNTTAGNVIGDAGAVIDLSSDSGAINLTTANMNASGANVTYGILATSVTGDITITTLANVNGNSGSDESLHIAAMRVQTAGEINLNINRMGARHIGIQTVATGNKNTTINLSDEIGLPGDAGLGVAAVDASSTGSGAITVNLVSGLRLVEGRSGIGVRLQSSGVQTINIAADRGIRTGVDGADPAGPGAVNMMGAGAKTITNNGILAHEAGGVVVRASGASFVLHNNSAGTLQGSLNLSGVTGTSTLNNTGVWTASGPSIFSAGASTLNNSGTLAVVGEAAFQGLETFNNSGVIDLGGTGLLAYSGPFSATGDSLISFTVDFAAGNQPDCSAAVAAGCLNLAGATVSGASGVRVLAADGLDTTAYSADTIVLVDVTGGTTAAGDFVLDAGSDGYLIDPGAGPVVASTGLFGYSLQYVSAAQQHQLVSVPLASAFEYVPAMQEVTSAWHTTADLAGGRQADLRAGHERGMWFRVMGERTERAFAPASSAGESDFVTDTSYTLYTGAALIGFDIAAGGSEGDSYVFGVHGGLVRTRMEIARSTATDDLDGVNLGLYGGLTRGALTLDGTLNVNRLNLAHNDLVLGDTAGNALSIGGRAEAGWMMGTGGFYIQPIVTAAYVTTDMNELYPAGYEISYNDVVSTRAAVGLRVGGNANVGAGSVGFWLTGRMWKEFSKEANVSIGTTDDDFVFVDDLSGEFNELNGGLTLDATDSIRIFVSGGAVFHEELDSYSGSVGVRLRW